MHSEAEAENTGDGRTARERCVVHRECQFGGLPPVLGASSCCCKLGWAATSSGNAPRGSHGPGRAGPFGVHSRGHKNRFVFVHGPDSGAEAESTGSWLIAAGRRIYIHCTRLRLYRHISVRLPAGIMVAAERSVGRSILVHTYTDACACGWDVGCCSCLFR